MSEPSHVFTRTPSYRPDYLPRDVRSDARETLQALQDEVTIKRVGEETYRVRGPADVLSSYSALLLVTARLTPNGQIRQDMPLHGGTVLKVGEGVYHVRCPGRARSR